jgi:hypothetical protein
LPPECNLRISENILIVNNMGTVNLIILSAEFLGAFVSQGPSGPNCDMTA